MNPIVKLVLLFLGVAAVASAVSVLAHGTLRESGSVVRANDVSHLEARIAALSGTVAELRESLDGRGPVSPRVRLDGTVSDRGPFYFKSATRAAARAEAQLARASDRPAADDDAGRREREGRAAPWWRLGRGARAGGLARRDPLAQRIARRKRALADAQATFAHAIDEAAGGEVEGEEAAASHYAKRAARRDADSAMREVEAAETAAATEAAAGIAADAEREVARDESNAVVSARRSFADRAAREVEADEASAVLGVKRAYARLAELEAEGDERAAAVNAASEVRRAAAREIEYDEAFAAFGPNGTTAAQSTPMGAAAAAPRPTAAAAAEPEVLTSAFARPIGPKLTNLQRLLHARRRRKADGTIDGTKNGAPLPARAAAGPAADAPTKDESLLPYREQVIRAVAQSEARRAKARSGALPRGDGYFSSVDEQVIRGVVQSEARRAKARSGALPRGDGFFSSVDEGFSAVAGLAAAAAGRRNLTEAAPRVSGRGGRW